MTQKILYKIACEHDVQIRTDFLHAIHTKFLGTRTEFVVINKYCKNNMTLCDAMDGPLLDKLQSLLIPLFVVNAIHLWLQ